MKRFYRGYRPRHGTEADTGQGELQRYQLNNAECRAPGGDAPFDLTRRTVVFLPGNMTCEGYPTAERSSAEYGRMILDALMPPNARHPDDLDYHRLIYDGSFANRLSVEYMAYRRWQPRDEVKDSVGKGLDIQAYKRHPQTHVSKEAARVADTMILPALMVPDGPSLRPLPEIRERLGRLTFVGNSYGTTFAHQLGTVLSRRLATMLKTQEMDEAQAHAAAQELLSHIVLLGIANVSHTDQPRAFTNIFFEGERDVMREYVQFAGNYGPEYHELYRQAVEHTPESEEREAEALRRIRGEPEHRPFTTDERLRVETMPGGTVVTFQPPMHLACVVTQDTSDPAYQTSSKRGFMGRLLNTKTKPLRAVEAQAMANFPLAHHPVSFLAPQPGAPEHTVLWQRVLRNTVSRDPATAPDPALLLMTPSRPLGALQGPGKLPLSHAGPDHDTHHNAWIEECLPTEITQRYYRQRYGTDAPPPLSTVIRAEVEQEDERRQHLWAERELEREEKARQVFEHCDRG